MQVARAGCNLLDSNCQSNTDVAAEVCKVPIKRTSGLTVRLYCKTSVSCNFVGVVSDFFYQNTKFIHDWPDKLNDPYGK